MKISLFCVFDQKAQAFLPPFNMPTDAMARRTFGDCINDPNHAFGRHPADYTLFRVAHFDDDTAQVRASKEALGNGVEYIREDRDEAQAPLFPSLEEQIKAAERTQ